MSATSNPAQPAPPTRAEQEDARPTLPLHLRLPNGPGALLAREDELRWLDEQSGPLLQIWGAAGVGKSALLLHWLQEQDQQPLQRILYLPLHQPASTEELIAQLLRSLLQATGEQREVERMLRDPQSAVAWIVDQADDGPWWLVLDADDSCPPQMVRPLLEPIARYARRSRWFLVSRAPALSKPRDSLLVEPLPPASLRALAEDWGLSQPDATLLERCDGSLRQLEQLLWGQPAAPKGKLEAYETATQQQALAIVASSQRPVHSAWLEELCGIQRQELEDMQRAGLLRWTPAGVSATKTGLQRAEREQSPQALIEQLGSARACELVLEALRMAFEQERQPLAAQLLEQRFEDLRRQGYLTELWGLLREDTDPSTISWRYRCAGVLADLAYLEHLDRPPLDDLESLAYWITALHHRGRHEELLQITAGISEEVEPAQRYFLDAIQLQRAQSMLSLGRHEQARELLQGHRPQDPELAFKARLIEARGLVMIQRQDLAAPIVEELQQLYAKLPRRMQHRLSYTMLYTDVLMHQYRHAAELAEALHDSGDPVVLGYPNLLLVASIFLQSASFERARSCVQRSLRMLPHHEPALLAYHQLLLYHLDLYQRPSAQLLDDLLELRGQLRGLEGADHDLLIFTEYLLRELGLLLHQPIAALPTPPEAGSTPSFVLLLQIAQAELAMMRADDEDAQRLDIKPDPRLEPKAFLRHGLYSCRAAMLAGRPSTRKLEELARIASEVGLLRPLLDILALRCQAALLESPDELSIHAEELRRRAELHESPRMHALASLFQQLARDPTDTAALAALLPTLADCSPQGSRLGRAALGIDAALNPLERRLLDALKEQHSWQPPRHLPGDGPAWGLDDKRVWSSSGATLELSARPIPAGLLTCLSRHDGSADKQTLLEEVWQIKDYHPLRHDNRLRLAVRKLRKNLETQLGLEDALQTTEEGYALRGPFFLSQASGED